MFTEGLNGLNVHVQVDPLSLSITTLPPTLPVLATVVEVPDELLDELPPQAAVNMHAATNNKTHLKRFIETLRSPFDKTGS
jgi:hypothetical protein